MSEKQLYRLEVWHEGIDEPVVSYTYDPVIPVIGGTVIQSRCTPVDIPRGDDGASTFSKWEACFLVALTLLLIALGVVVAWCMSYTGGEP